MKKKNWLLLSILISAFISVILILVCFYRYSKAINNDYIKRSKEEAFSHSYLNSQLFKSQITNTIGELGILAGTYFTGKDAIDEDSKQQFYEYVGYENINLYTKEEIQLFYEQGYNALMAMEGKKSYVYLYKEKDDINKLEIILPIYNYNKKLIGGISTHIKEDEFTSFYSEDPQTVKFSTYIFDFSGDIVFGGHVFGNNNIYDVYDEIVVNKGVSSKELLVEKIKNRKSFEAQFTKDDKKYYAFFYPTQDKFYTLEIMPFEYVKKYTQENSKILLVVLMQVITIVFVQLLLLFYIIINQNKKLIKTEVSKNRQLDTIINSVPGGVIKMLGDEDLKILFANEGFYDLTGYTKEEYRQKFDNRHIDIIEPYDRNNLLSQIKNFKVTTNKIAIEYKIIKKDGTKCSVALTGEYLEDFFNIPIYQCIVTDMTEYKKVLNDLELEKEQYDIISKMSDEIIFEYYIKNDHMVISEKYKETFNVDFSGENFIKNLIKNNTIHKEDIKKFIKTIKNIKNSDGFIRDEIRIKNIFGDYNWASYQGFIINDAEDNIYKIVGKISNIDKFKKEIEELKEKSRRDPLTKVYNKATIETIVNDAIEKYPKNKHALFIIDVDNFKGVNDTFGHIFGDAVLKNIANNICNICGEQDFMGRIGGDEFVLFLQNVQDFEYITNMANEVCNVFRRVYQIQNREHKISASIGISTYAEDGKSYTELLAKADIAVYNSKNEGKDRYKIYNESMQHISLLDTRKVNNEEDELRNFKRRSVYENVLITISEMFLQIKNMHATINLILSTICKSYCISRAYIFEVCENNNFMFNTYEWCDDNVKPLIKEKQKIPFNEEEFLEAYNEKPFLYYNCKEDLEKNDIIASYMYEKDKINLYFSCYFMEQGKVKGLIGFEIYNNEYMWDEEEIEGAFLVARLIGTQILKDKLDKKLNTESQINDAIVNNQQLYTYIVKEDTFEMVYFNDKIDKIIPDAKIGDICYKQKGYNKHCNYCPIRGSIQHLDNNSTKYFCEIADMWLGATSTKIKWIDGTDAYIVCARDISEYIEQINYTDSLTGIPSITKFKIQANNILNNIEYSDYNYCLVYMDIDKFKYINDTFGYVRGDDVLKTFAMILYEGIRENEIFCRFNDDRFLAIIRYKSEDEILLRLNTINKKIEKMKKLFFSDMKLTIICGLYKINKEDKDLNAIIDKANIARKSIKGSHKSGYAIYNKEMNETTLKEKMIEGRMSYALKNDEFLTYLQPKFDLFTNKICGAEALVRWKQKNGKMIYPNDFIPIFEKNGFIVNLDLNMYEKVFKKMKQWLDDGLDVVPISLNVSREHTASFDFVKKILNLINRYNIPSSLVEFELTESIFATDLAYLNDFIQEIRKSGFKVSIDDFGSAYSSLNLLKEIDVDVIKLDKGFLTSQKDFENNNKDKIVIEYIVKMAKELNLQVVCEGIETQQQIDLLKEIGCKIGQGYIFSEPISIEQFEETFYKS